MAFTPAPTGTLSFSPCLTESERSDKMGDMEYLEQQNTSNVQPLQYLTLFASSPRDIPHLTYPVILAQRLCVEGYHYLEEMKGRRRSTCWTVQGSTSPWWNCSLSGGRSSQAEMWQATLSFQRGSSPDCSQTQPVKVCKSQCDINV